MYFSCISRVEPFCSIPLAFFRRDLHFAPFSVFRCGRWIACTFLVRPPSANIFGMQRPTPTPSRRSTPADSRGLLGRECSVAASTPFVRLRQSRGSYGRSSCLSATLPGVVLAFGRCHALHINTPPYELCLAAVELMACSPNSGVVPPHADQFLSRILSIAYNDSSSAHRAP